MKVSMLLCLLCCLGACRSVECPGPAGAALPSAVSPGAVASLAAEGSLARASVEAASVSLPTDGIDGSKAAQRTISLEEVLDLVSTQGLDLALARQRLETARANEDIARSAWYPQLSVGTAYRHLDGQAQATVGAIFDVQKQQASLDLGLDLAFDLGDALFGGEAAEHRTRSSAYDSQAAAADAVTLAANSYFDLVETTARIGIAEEALEHASQLVELQRARLAQGAGLELDLVASQAHEARVRRALIGARSEARIASSLLIELLQLDPSVPLLPWDGPGQLPARIDLGDRAQEQPGPARSGRAEVARDQEELAARLAEEQKANWDWALPDLFVSARLGTLGANYGQQSRRETYAAGLRWNLGAQFFGERDRRRSLRREAELSAARTRAVVAREIDSALARSEAARQQVEAVAHEVSAAHKALELATSRYDHGAGLLIEVLQAQLAAARARSSQVAAVVGANRAQYVLWRALGGARPENRSR